MAVSLLRLKYVADNIRDEEKKRIEPVQSIFGRVKGLIGTILPENGGVNTAWFAPAPVPGAVSVNS